MNKVVDDLKNGQPANGEGRRETVVKFTPKTMVIKGNKSVTSDMSKKITEKFTTLKELFSFKEGMEGYNDTFKYAKLKNKLDEVGNPITDNNFNWYSQKCE